MKWSGRHRSDDRGAVLVEAAVVMPILIMLVLGIWSVGRAYNIYLTMDHAAREAARFGAVNADDASWLVEVKQKALGEASPSLTLAGADVCAALVDGEADATACLNSTDDPRTEKRAQVVITKQVPLSFLFFNMNVTLHARAVSRWEAGTT